MFCIISVPLRSTLLNSNSIWKKNGITVAGGNGAGASTNQLNVPHGLFVDDDQTLYIAEYGNSRIVEWKSGATNGRVIVGGNGSGSRLDQISNPGDVIVDKVRDCLFIGDSGNNRVLRWSLRGENTGEIITNDESRSGSLTMDEQGYLYVTDAHRQLVKRWGVGENQGVVVAGGNGVGDQLNQFNIPTKVFVDRDLSVYVSDGNNDRVMKWVKGANKGIVVAGGRGKGSSLSQLNYPEGVVVDQLGTVYVADRGNHRIMRWRKGAQEVLKETESMISHTKSSFIKSWKEFQHVYNTANNDDTLKQSKGYEEARQIYDELNKAHQEDRLVQA
ncbi:unnamed protein product [Rotaria sp. Silwood1]|nr:unnamed protein product [Rotaria sp. Silwood1]CAF3837960.1 unnamed protein product [Rotaria sp. Silwood1]